MQVQRTTRRDITHPWRWRTAVGQMLLPEQMTCSHIANTLIMIWNHSVPEHMQTHSFNHYRFNGVYTTQYMRAAVAALIKELDKRKPVTLNEKQRERIAIIKSWLNTAEFEEVFSVTHVRKLKGPSS